MRNFLELMTMSLASFKRKVNEKGVEMNNNQLFLNNFINHTCINHIFIPFCEKISIKHQYININMHLIPKVTSSSTLAV